MVIQRYLGQFYETLIWNVFNVYRTFAPVKNDGRERERSLLLLRLWKKKLKSRR
jgi:hypothetical protein